MGNFVFRVFRAIRRRSRREILLLVPTWIILGACRGAVVFISFEAIIRISGLKSNAFPATPLANPQQYKIAIELARAVILAAACSPWRANCLPQALCAIYLLRFYRIPHAVFMGLRRDESDGTIKAHAWVCAGPITVTGGVDNQVFTIVGCFS